MLVVRGRLLSAVALLMGALLVTVGFATPAEAATARSLRVSVSPTAVQAGGLVSVSGRLKPTPAGSTVKVQRKVGSSWVNIGSTRTTSSYGGYRVKVRMPTSPGYYQLRTAAGRSSAYDRAVSAPVTVAVVRSIIVKFATNKDSISPGETVTLTGKVYPFVAGTVATIQRFNGVSWATLVTTTVRSDGTVKRYLKPSASTTYRLLVPRAGLYGKGVSKAVKVLIPLGPADPVITTTTLPDGRTDVAYNQTLQVDGEAGTWTVTSGQLPPGLSLNTSTGAITGTPTAGGDFDFTVTFSETATLLSDTQDLSIKVRVSPRITTSALPAATGFVTYGPVTLQKTGQAGTWSLTGSLPTGLSFDTGTGVISGKPTIKTAGSYPLSFTFTETAAPQLSVTKALTLTLNAAPNPVITTTSLPSATAFSNYGTTLTKTGNAGTWSITAGSLPTGLSFNTTTGAITGKPTVSGSFPLTFRYTETESTTFASKQLTLLVNPAPDPVISTTTLDDGLINAGYSSTLAVSTTPPGTWSVDSGSLPAGMTLSPEGVISGTPTVSGVFSFTVRFTETESGTFDTQALQLRINSRPVITTTALPDALKENSYQGPNDSQVFLASTGGSGSKSWSLASGSLPTGLTLSSSGKISGTATVSGDFTFTVRVSDLITGATDTKALSIHVDNVAIFTATAPAGEVGTPYVLQYDGRPYNIGFVGWTRSSGTLPPGLDLSSTGRLDGTPTQAGDYTFTVSYTVLLKGTRSRTYTLHIDP